MNAQGKFEPARLVTLDFETYYANDYTLSSPKINLSEYVRDARFLAHCVGIKIGRRTTKWYAGEKIRQAIEAIDWKTHDLLAHNTHFDGLILQHHYGVVPRFYYDTLSMSRALHGVCMRHNLDAMSKAYGLEGKVAGALVKTKGKRVLTEEELDDLGYYCTVDVDLTHTVFRAMLKHFPHEELRQIDLTMRMFCDPVLEVDVEACAAHEKVEFEQTEALIAKTGATRTALNSNPQFAALLEALGVEPPLKISTRTGHETFAFAKSDPEFEALLEHEDYRVVQLTEARLAAKSTIEETRARRMATAGRTGKLPVGYNYCGAHTTRWSGTNKLNLQNLPRTKYDAQGAPIEGSDTLRRSILAPRGHQIVVVDSANIELRVNAWLAGHDALLEIIRASDAGKGPDPYCVMATDIYARVITKLDKIERFVGKTAHLGLGFGMGPPKFQGTLITNADLDMDAPMCKFVVGTYRTVNAPIVTQWKYFDNMLTELCAWTSGKDVEGAYGPGDVLQWRNDGCAQIVLPSGLGIYYPGLHVQHHDNGRFRGYAYVVHGALKNTWGGTITENVVQGIARCIVAWQMLQIQRRGHRVVMMTHDEVIAIAPNRKAERCLSDMMDIMRTPPPYATGLPLNAEGGFDVCYSK